MRTPWVHLKKGLPYPDATLQEWIDQAKLAQYFYDEKKFAALRSLGIRTYSAMQQYQIQVRGSPAILDTVDPAPIPKDQFRHFVLYGQFP